jgi:hypothetical protein
VTAISRMDFLCCEWVSVFAPVGRKLDFWRIEGLFHKVAEVDKRWIEVVKYDRKLIVKPCEKSNTF